MTHHLRASEQERELFGFLFSGLSSVESLTYGLYAVGALLQPSSFREMASTKGNLRAITPRATAAGYQRGFPRHGLEATLTTVLDDPQFVEWSDHRNVLSHRSTPSRTVFVTNTQNPQPSAISKLGIRIEPNALTTRKEWLSSTLTSVLEAADSFTADVVG